MSEQRDQEVLRRAIALSEAAVAQGARPFGAVVCDGEGRIVSEAGSVAPVDPRDWTRIPRCRRFVRPRRR
jgi:tRNA(Arg) A34 adenosine deaminase TadA